MPLSEPLEREWRESRRGAVRHLEITRDGVVLGKTVLAPFTGSGLVVDGERICAMLSVTYGLGVPEAVIDSFRHAGRCFKRGDVALANMHLALTGLLAVDLEKAQRLFAADWALSRGIPPTLLRKIAGVLRKDDEDDSEDDGSDDSDSGDDGDSSDFDAAHPRWPAGSPGGIGGEFAPKDAGDATSALHEAISQGVAAQGTQVAADDSIESDVAPASWGNPSTLNDHFDRHGADFGAESPEDYANQANKFFQQAQKNGYSVKVDSDGYTRIYDPETNIFGSYNPNGTTRTFFMPNEGAAYFDGQAPVTLTPSASTPTATETAPASQSLNIINTEPTLEEEQTPRLLPGTSLLYSPYPAQLLEEKEEEPKL